MKTLMMNGCEVKVKSIFLANSIEDHVTITTSKKKLSDDEIYVIAKYLYDEAFIETEELNIKIVYTKK